MHKHSSETRQRSYGLPAANFLPCPQLALHVCRGDQVQLSLMLHDAGHDAVVMALHDS